MKVISSLLLIWAVLNLIGFGLVLLPVGTAPGQGEGIARECGAISRRIESIRLANCKVAARIIEGRSKVSYYHDMFDGRLTASGRVFKQDERQIAHKKLQFGTMVFFMQEGAATVAESQKPTAGVNTSWRFESSPSCQITHGWITDRGPFAPGRDWDLSRGMAVELGIIEDGVAEVEWIGLLPEGRTE